MTLHQKHTNKKALICTFVPHMVTFKYDENKTRQKWCEYQSKAYFPLNVYTVWYASDSDSF